MIDFKGEKIRLENHSNFSLLRLILVVLAAFGRKVRDFKKEEKGLVFLAQRETSVD